MHGTITFCNDSNYWPHEKSLWKTLFQSVHSWNEKTSTRKTPPNAVLRDGGGVMQLIWLACFSFLDIVHVQYLITSYKCTCIVGNGAYFMCKRCGRYVYMLVWYTCRWRKNYQSSLNFHSLYFRFQNFCLMKVRSMLQYIFMPLLHVRKLVSLMKRHAHLIDHCCPFINNTFYICAGNSASSGTSATTQFLFA